MFVLVYMYVHSNYDDRWVVQTDRQTDLFEQFIYIYCFLWEPNIVLQKKSIYKLQLVSI